MEMASIDEVITNYRIIIFLLSGLLDSFCWWLLLISSLIVEEKNRSIVCFFSFSNSFCFVDLMLHSVGISQ
jgi:hypothetical protein